MSFEEKPCGSKTWIWFSASSCLHGSQHITLRTKACHRHMHMISLLIFSWKWIKLVKIIWGHHSPDCTFLFDLNSIYLLFAIVYYSFFVRYTPLVYVLMAFVCALVYSVAQISVYHFWINPQLQACFEVSIFWGIYFLEAWKGNASPIYKGMPHHLHVLHFVLHARKVN